MLVKLIDKSHSADINIPNQPFVMFGRFVVSYDGKWNFTTQPFAPCKMTFPDENYDFDAMASNTFFLGAYDGEKCVGLAVLKNDFFKYMYLYDLKVNADYRKQGVASLLVESACTLALEKGYIGLYTQAQDNNLGACLFYTKCGFEIGGLNTRVYDGTKQFGKSDVFFYKRLR